MQELNIPRIQLLSTSLHFLLGGFLDGTKLAASGSRGFLIHVEQEVETSLLQLFWQSLRFGLIGLAWLT